MNCTAIENNNDLFVNRMRNELMLCGLNALNTDSKYTRQVRPLLHGSDQEFKFR